MAEEKKGMPKTLSIEDIEETYSVETQLVLGKNYTKSWDYSHHIVPPITTSNAYRLESASRGAEGFIQFGNTTPDQYPIYIYDRLGEPNKDMLEEDLCLAEGGECAVTFASGMGAISGILGTLTKPGDHVIAHQTLYGCTFSLLKNWYPRYKIDVSFLNLTKNLEEVKKEIRPETRVVYFETPVNPTLELIDIQAIADMVKEANAGREDSNRIYVVVDNTFASPVGQRPLSFGADFSVHSLTKHISGFGTELGGVVIGPKKFHTALLMYRKDFGAVLAPRTAWALSVYGLPTLPLRIRESTRNAEKIAKYLEEREEVERVFYPGLASHPEHELAKKQMLDVHGEFIGGALIYFILKGKSLEDQKKKGEKFVDYVSHYSYTMTLAVSLGQTRTLIEHPGSMTHAAIPAEDQLKGGISPGGVRLAVGITPAEDTIRDLGDAFDSLLKE